MKRILAVVVGLAFLSLNFSVAQSQKKVDSLKHLISISSGFKKYDPMIGLIRVLYLYKEDEALALARQAQSLAQQYADSAKIVQSTRICGQLLNRLDQPKEALTFLKAALPIAERYNLEDELKKIYDNLSISYTYLAEYDKSLKYSHQALLVAEKNKDDLEISFSLNNIGIAYGKMENFREALSYYTKALEYQIKSGDDFDIETQLSNIGFCYNRLKEYTKAQEYFYKAYEKIKNDYKGLAAADIHYGLGISFYHLNDYKKAIEEFKTSYRIAETLGYKISLAENLVYLSKIDVAESRLSAAESKLHEVKRISKNEGYKELLMDAYHQLSDIYETRNDLLNNIKYLKKYVAIKDSVYNKHVFNQIMQSKIEYTQNQNMAIIKANEITIAQQKKFNIAIIVIAVMATVLVFVLLRNNRAMRMVNKELSKAQDVIFEQNKQLDIRNKELDKLVEKKTEELKLVNLSLREMNTELDTFIHKTAQDIRAPLASLRGICNVAILDTQDEDHLVYLHKINSTTELLNSILKRLLTVSKISNSKISLSEIELKTFVDQVISVQKKKGLPKNLVVRKNIAENAIVHSDKELLSIVLENSIDNAIKFCNNSPQAEHFIEINMEPAKNGRVNVRVIDNRKNVNPYGIHDIDQIFFNSTFDIEQPHEEHQDLYFVKTAARKIGGKVDVKKTREGYNELSVVL